MMNEGYVGKILKVDLSTRQARAVDLQPTVVRNFIGGLGLGMKILYDEVGPDIDPLSPDNVIVLATGPLSGTTAPTNGRTHVVTKSPLTGIIGMGNFGGWWGPRLKLAGFEGIIIRGKSDKPVYLWIDNDVVEVRNAEHLWGKYPSETVDALRARLGQNVSVLAIGPAGENLVRFACPVSDYFHSPGRSASGCVMGYKKLKAIAVRGTNATAIAAPEKFEEAKLDAEYRIVSYPEAQIRVRMGVGSMHKVKRTAVLGVCTSRNFTSGVIAPDSDIWGLPESAKKHLVEKLGHYGYHCMMARYYGCDLVTDVKSGKYAGLQVSGISYSLPTFEWGGNNGINSYPAIWRCRELCNQYGMDQLTPIPFAMELFEKGIITKEDTGGLELKWGDEDAIQQMLHKIAYREDIGDVLAEGNVRAAKKIGKGAEKYVMTVKGMPILEGWDPRGTRPTGALGLLVCPRGGDNVNTTHTAQQESYPYWAPMLGWSKEYYIQWLLDRLDMFEEVKEKIYGVPPHAGELTPQATAVFTKWHGELTSVFDSLGLCMFTGNAYIALGPTRYAKLYSTCTGWQITPSELMKSGERIFNLMRAYIVREGLTRKDDHFPDRFYKEPILDGPSKGSILRREHIDRLLDEYYQVVGWDKETGIPTEQKLVELGLDYVADELSNLGLI